MADKVSEIYGKAVQKGILAEGMTEDQFREKTSTEKGLRSFYDYASTHGMKFHDYETFKQRFYGTQEETVNSNDNQLQTVEQPASAVDVVTPTRRKISPFAGFQESGVSAIGESLVTKEQEQRWKKKEEELREQKRSQSIIPEPSSPLDRGPIRDNAHFMRRIGITKQNVSTPTVGEMKEQMNNMRSQYAQEVYDRRYLNKDGKPKDSYVKDLFENWQAGVGEIALTPYKAVEAVEDLALDAENAIRGTQFKHGQGMATRFVNNVMGGNYLRSRVEHYRKEGDRYQDNKGILESGLEGDLGTAAGKAVLNTIQSAPNLAVSIYSGKKGMEMLGGAFLGTTAALQKYDEIKDNDSISAEDKALAMFGAFVSECVPEIIGAKRYGKMFNQKTVGSLRKETQKEVLSSWQKFINSGIVKQAGKAWDWIMRYFGEGLTESMTDIMNLGIDLALGIKDEVTKKDLMSIGDSFIVGQLSDAIPSGVHMYQKDKYKHAVKREIEESPVLSFAVEEMNTTPEKIAEIASKVVHEESVSDKDAELYNKYQESIANQVTEMQGIGVLLSEAGLVGKPNTYGIFKQAVNGSGKTEDEVRAILHKGNNISDEEFEFLNSLANRMREIAIGENIQVDEKPEEAEETQTEETAQELLSTGNKPLEFTLRMKVESRESGKTSDVEKDVKVSFRSNGYRYTDDGSIVADKFTILIGGKPVTGKKKEAAMAAINDKLRADKIVADSQAAAEAQAQAEQAAAQVQAEQEAVAEQAAVQAEEQRVQEVYAGLQQQVGEKGLEVIKRFTPEQKFIWTMQEEGVEAALEDARIYLNEASQEKDPTIRRTGMRQWQTLIDKYGLKNESVAPEQTTQGAELPTQPVQPAQTAEQTPTQEPAQPAVEQKEEPKPERKPKKESKQPAKPASEPKQEKKETLKEEKKEVKKAEQQKQIKKARKAPGFEEGMDVFAPDVYLVKDTGGHLSLIRAQEKPKNAVKKEHVFFNNGADGPYLVWPYKGNTLDKRRDKRYYVDKNGDIQEAFSSILVTEEYIGDRTVFVNVLAPTRINVSNFESIIKTKLKVEGEEYTLGEFLNPQKVGSTQNDGGEGVKYLSGYQVKAQHINERTDLTDDQKAAALDSMLHQINSWIRQWNSFVSNVLMNTKGLKEEDKMPVYAMNLSIYRKLRDKYATEGNLKELDDLQKKIMQVTFTVSGANETNLKQGNFNNPLYQLALMVDVAQKAGLLGGEQVEISLPESLQRIANSTVVTPQDIEKERSTYAKEKEKKHKTGPLEAEFPEVLNNLPALVRFAQPKSEKGNRSQSNKWYDKKLGEVYDKMGAALQRIEEEQKSGEELNDFKRRLAQAYAFVMSGDTATLETINEEIQSILDSHQDNPAFQKAFDAMQRQIDKYVQRQEQNKEALDRANALERRRQLEIERERWQQEKDDANKRDEARAKKGEGRRERYRIEEAATKIAAINAQIKALEEANPWLADEFRIEQEVAVLRELDEQLTKQNEIMAAISAKRVENPTDADRQAEREQVERLKQLTEQREQYEDEHPEANERLNQIYAEEKKGGLTTTVKPEMAVANENGVPVRTPHTRIVLRALSRVLGWAGIQVHYVGNQEEARKILAEKAGVPEFMVFDENYELYPHLEGYEVERLITAADERYPNHKKNQLILAYVGNFAYLCSSNGHGMVPQVLVRMNPEENKDIVHLIERIIRNGVHKRTDFIDRITRELRLREEANRNSSNGSYQGGEFSLSTSGSNERQNTERGRDSLDDGKLYQENISDEIEYFKSPKGTILGWAIGNDIYLTQEGLNSETPIHEYTHLWVKSLRNENPEAWSKIVALCKKNKRLWDDVVNDPAYKNIKGDEDAIASEMLARYSGKNGAVRLEDAAREIARKSGVNSDKLVDSLISNMRNALQEFWRVIKDLFRINNNVTIEEVADLVLKDLFDGKPLNLNTEEMNAIKEQAIKDGTFMKAPNGQDTKLTERQWLSVRTKAFKDWYGDWENPQEGEQYLLDEETGEPMVVFHGTAEAGFDLFDPQDNGVSNGRGIFTTPQRYVAGVYAKLVGEEENEFEAHIGKDEHRGIYSLFANIKNPMVVDCINPETGEPSMWDKIPSGIYKIVGPNMATQYFDNYDDAVEWMYDNGFGMEWQEGNEEVEEPEIIPEFFTTDMLVDMAREQGYDGVVFNNIIDGTDSKLLEGDEDSNMYMHAHQVVVAMTPNQLKSAVSNNGLFSQEDARIEYQYAESDLSTLDVKTEKRIRREEDNAKSTMINPDLSEQERANWWENVVTMIADKSNGMRLILNSINAYRKLRGEEPLDGDKYDVRTKFEACRSIIANKVGFLERGIQQELDDTIREFAQVVADSQFYKDHMKEVGGDKPTTLTPVQFIERYLMARNNWERAKEGVPRGLAEFKERMGMGVIEFSNAFTEAYGEKTVLDLWEKIRQMTDFALDTNYEGGMISEELYQELKSKKFYVPQRGFWDDVNPENEENAADDLLQRRQRGNSVARNKLDSMHKAEGGKSLAEGCLAYIARDARQAIKLSEENKVKKVMFDLLRDNEDWCHEPEHNFKVPRQVYYMTNENGEIVRLDDGPTEEQKQEMRQLKSIIRQLKEEYMKAETDEERDAIMEEIYATEEQLPYFDEKDSYRILHTRAKTNKAIVGLYVNGYPCEIEMTPRFVSTADALNGRVDRSGEIAGLKTVTSWLSAQFTMNNPTFFAVNITRDTPLILTKGAAEYGPEFSARFTVNWAKSQKAIWNYLLTGKVDDSEIGAQLLDFLNYGGNTGYSNLEEMDRWRRRVADMNPGGLQEIRQKLSSVEGAKDAAKMIGKGLLKFGDKTISWAELRPMAQVLNEWSEIISRFSAYKSVVDMGLGVNEGIKAAHNLSTNFNRRGLGHWFINFFNSLTVFANAGIQGASGYWRTFDSQDGAKGVVKKVAKTAAYMGMLPAFLGFLSTMLNPDDDDYEYAVSEYERDNYVILGDKRLALNEQLKPWWVIGVNIAQLARGKRTLKQSCNSILTSMFTNWIPLPQNLTGSANMLIENMTGKEEWNIAQIARNAIMPSAMQTMNQWADNKNFLGGKLRYDIGDIPEYDMAPNEAALYQDLAKVFYLWGGGNEKVPSKTKEGGEKIRRWWDVNPKEIKSNMFWIPSGALDNFCLAYGIYKDVREKMDGDFTETNVRVKDLPVINRFYKPSDNTLYRFSVVREARDMVKIHNDRINNLKKQAAHFSDVYSQTRDPKADEAYAEALRLLSEEMSDVTLVEMDKILSVYNKSSIRSLQQELGETYKDLKRYHPDAVKDLDAAEKDLVQLMLEGVNQKKGLRRSDDIPEWIEWFDDHSPARNRRREE